MSEAIRFLSNPCPPWLATLPLSQSIRTENRSVEKSGMATRGRQAGRANLLKCGLTHVPGPVVTEGKMSVILTSP